MSHDKIKAAVRQRVADTGEPYAEARRQVLTSPGSVFSEPTVPRDAPLGWAEPSVNFLLESTRPVAAKGRKTINHWYSHFPDPDRKFRARLRSSKGTDYEVAQDELFVHERLVGNARVSYEEGGAGPDFRLYRGPDYVGAIEVLSLFMAGDWSGQQNQHGRIADELNRRLTLDKWFVSFEVKKSDRDPSFKSLAAWIDRTISSLPDPAGVDGRTQAAIYTAEGIQAGGRYDLRNAPLALCVCIHDPFCSLDQLETALYGRVQRIIKNSIRRNIGRWLRGRNQETC